MPRHKEFNEVETLTRAMNTFWHRGYEAASITELEKEMEIGRGSIYLAFGDKHDLFLAALEAYCDQMVDTFSRAFDDSTSTKDALKRVFREQSERYRSGKGCDGCFLTNSIIELAPKDEDVARITSGTLSRMEELLHSSLVRDQRAGRVRSDRRPRTLARYLISQIQGLSVMIKAGTGRSALRDILDIALETLEP
ncbi:MAG: TetR/AcrR family transcriptional regulator [Planctomycetota bacterium]|nr:TetR/AcrR family transcriptional regulator [Planctomycetota bacterium]